MSSYENYKPTIINYSSFDEVPIEEREKLKEYHLKSLREKRNQLLQETDKYVLIDYPITTEKLAIIKEYRQALRDFTNNNYIMPEKPVFL
jgi:hypothetical protein